MGKAADWLEQVAGISVEFIGRRIGDKARTLEASGAHLSYTIKIDGSGWIWLSACPMDSGLTEKLVSLAEGQAGWRTVCRLLHALERAEIRSLNRPIHRRRSRKLTPCLHGSLSRMNTREQKS
jgi:hypothetical protein